MITLGLFLLALLIGWFLLKFALKFLLITAISFVFVVGFIRVAFAIWKVASGA